MDYLYIHYPEVGNIFAYIHYPEVGNIFANISVKTKYIGVLQRGLGTKDSTRHKKSHATVSLKGL